MKFYKQEILNKLVETGWELVLSEDTGEWWLDEFWRIRSTKQKWGMELFLYFLVDPQYDGADKANAVLEVEVSDKLLSERPIDDLGIAELYLQKGRFNENIQAFVRGINNYRNRENT